MTRGEIWKDFFKKTVLTVLIAGVLFYWAALVFTKDGATNYFYVWLCCGIPFGIRGYVRMAYPTRLRPFRHGGRRCAQLHCGRLDRQCHSDMAACGRAAWYIPLTIYRLLNVGRVGVAEIGEE